VEQEWLSWEMADNNRGVEVRFFPRVNSLASDEKLQKCQDYCYGEGICKISGLLPEDSSFGTGNVPDRWMDEERIVSIERCLS